MLSGTKTTAQVCREQQLKPELVSRWKQELVAGASLVFDRERSGGEEQERIAELERLVGRLFCPIEYGTNRKLERKNEWFSSFDVLFVEVKIPGRPRSDGPVENLPERMDDSVEKELEKAGGANDGLRIDRDSAGRVCRVVDLRGARTTFEYDRYDQLIKVMRPTAP